jgi:hypothetical protein
MRHSIVYSFFIVTLGAFVSLLFIIRCYSNHLQHYQGVFLTWDGVFTLDEHRGPGPRDLVCIVQYVHKPSPRFVADVEGIDWFCPDPTEYRFGLPNHSVVNVYSEQEEIERILKGLNQPEYQAYSKYRSYYKIQSEHCLLLISASRCFEPQDATYAVRVPFVLTENGYAVTPRGKDRTLYKILTSALEEWDARLKDEEKRRELLQRKNDMIFLLYKEARESEHVDYNALFNELKKLDALHGIKDPKELEQEIQKQKEGLIQMRGCMEPNQI